MKNKTNYIPHSLIIKIYGAINELIGIETKEGYYFCYKFTTDANGINGEFWQDN